MRPVNTKPLRISPVHGSPGDMAGSAGTGVVVWLTGLPSSGKTTLAERACAALRAEGRAACVLDGDAVRAAVHPAPGYGPAARDDQYATLADLAALLARQDLVVLVSATAHRRAWREHARVVAPRFVEVHVQTSVEECAARDAKGLYARARAGEVLGLPGVDVDYEAPAAPEIVAQGGLDAVALTRIVERVRGR